MTTPSALSAQPTTAAPRPPSSASEWRRRLPQEGRPVNYQPLPVEVLSNRTPPRKFIRKYRPVERVVCRLDMFGVPGDALCIAEAAEPAPATPAAPPVPTSPAAPFYTLAHRRAGQRWSALVSAPTSRVAHAMRRALGEVHWAAFVAHATAHYKPAFLAVFQRRVLRCVGRYGRPCPRGFAVELASPVAADALPLLHLDHEQDVQITCDMWRTALPPTPASWDDGVDGALLCHLLFGVAEDPVHGRSMLRFRCGPAGLGSDEGYCMRAHAHRRRNHTRL